MDMLAKYEAAQRLLTQHTRNAVLNGRPSVTWMDGFRFSYPRQVRGETRAVDMEPYPRCFCIRISIKQV